MAVRRPRALLSWSTGKDSAWALHLLRAARDVDVVGLLCTLVAGHERVTMHGVRRVLLEAQAEATGLPLWPVELPSPCPNADYEHAMGLVLARAAGDGIEAIAFGDLFLDDIRRYREGRLAGTGIRPLFPLWGLPTDVLARDMLAGGMRAHLTCVDPARLAPEWAGRAWDEDFLAALPAGVDPCGEYGEFHTFAAAGPMFHYPIPVRTGPVDTRAGFVFADLLPA
jgi:uncharacterized protein (TIGR00290 family)